MNRLIGRVGMVAALTLAASGTGASPAAGTSKYGPAHQVGPVGFTCLHRASDGFNGCWADGEPSSNGNGNNPLLQGCTVSAITFDKYTPTNRAGIPRTNAISARFYSDWYGPGGYAPWVGLGGAAYVPNVGDIGRVQIALGMQNSFAHVWVTASSNNGYCSLYT